MKKLVTIILVLAMALAIMPASGEKAPAEERHQAGSVIVDTDGSDGYTGDYVVIYNPATSVSNSKSTGNMAGLIKTEIEPYAAPAAEANEALYRIDVEPLLAEKAKEFEAENAPKPVQPVKRSFNVGDVREFLIYNYSPAGMYIDFKVLAKGEHCYIWTPVSHAENIYPLDTIDPAFAQMAADEFDGKFPLMQESFGNHENGSEGDGRLHILYYNIDDGWQPGEGYVAGYFWASDLYLNGLPILNIDTYPGVHYVNAEGVVDDDISSSYGVMMHEYQHLINYSETGGSDTWINECMSAAAEEICYPGSSIVRRIQSWTDHYYSEHDDWHTPPAEFLFNSTWSLHKGYSMYGWDNNMNMDDLLALYAQVSLFAQYIYTQYGNTTFHGIMQQLKQGRSFVQGFQNVTGQPTADFVGNFRAAVTANAISDAYGGIYGFRPQEGYDPAEYHDIANPYQLLAPVVFTAAQCAVKGGGAICVKPVGGVYNPPAGADSGLRYYGITVVNGDFLLGDVDRDGQVTSADALLVLRFSLGLINGLPDMEAADVNHDGSIDSTDALMILRLALGVTDHF